MPLVGVIVVLAVLAVAPAVNSLRVRRLRRFTTDVIAPAQLRATDVAASLAEEMFAVGMYAASSRAEQSSVYQGAAAAEHADVLQLDSLVRFMSPDAVEQFAQYREAATRWHDDVDDLMRRPAASAADLDTARTSGLAALEAARRLTAGLDSDYEATRERVRAAEQVDVLLPVVLVPLALLACALVVRAGRDMADIAFRADRDRRALAVAMEQKNAFMRGITHDLQNPLGAARGHVDLMLEGIISPSDWRGALERVRNLVTTASESVASLLAVARSEAGEMQLARAAVDLCVLVRDAIDDHRSLAVLKRQSVAFEDSQGCRAVADAGRVRHIVDNLLSNSIKYTPAGGRIRLAVSGRERDGRTWAAVMVEDSGPGIPAESRERVFQEFTRLPDTRDLAAGTGIGLTVSRRVARMMGGDVTLDDQSENRRDREPLGGAVFTLWLPAADDGKDRGTDTASGNHFTVIVPDIALP